MNQTERTSRAPVKASNPSTGAAGVGARASGLRSPLRWLGAKLSSLVSWVAKRLPAPVRWLARLLAPGQKRGFAFWWLVATLAVAVALGLIVALLLFPVAGLLGLLVLAIWLLVRRRKRKRGDQSARAAHASELR